MSSSFDRAVEKTLEIEGGFVDHPADPGGKTRYGITEGTARRMGYDGPMDELPLATAKNIYRRAYWHEMNLDQIAQLSELVAFKLFDAGVNVGTHRAVKWLQRTLNLFNRRGTRYKDIAVDGICGPVTVSALAAYIRWREEEGVEVLLKALGAIQGSYYVTIAEHNAKLEDFVYGWIRTRI